MARCSQCARENSEGERFCVDCGVQLEGASGSHEPGVRPRYRTVVPFVIAGALSLLALGIFLYTTLKRESVEDYLPVEPKGRTWEYSVTATPGGIVWKGTQRTTLMGEQTFEGERAIVYETHQVWHTSFLGTPVERADDFKFYYVVSKDFIRIIGLEEKHTPPRFAGGDISEVKVKFTPPVSQIKSPLRIGTSWEEKTERITLKSMEGGRDLGSSRMTEIYSWSIVANERVTVPAGTFDALKLELRRSSNGGRLLLTVWRSKGVGIIKFSSSGSQGELKEMRLPK